MNNDDISHFSTIPASFAIKSNVYSITHQCLIINNSQSQRALSVSVRTVLWIYFASRRNCGLLPIAAVGPGLIFQDDYAQLHNYEYFHEGNDDLTHMEWLAYSHNLNSLKRAQDM